MKITGKDLMKLHEETGRPVFCTIEKYNTEGGHIIEFESNLPFLELNIPDSLIDEYIKKRDKKYYIHLFEGVAGYLNYDKDDKEYSLNDGLELEHTKTQFTTAEINDLCAKYPYIDFWACAEEVTDNV